jgi:hypothetical protein
MKTRLIIFCLLSINVVFTQSDWQFKPYVVVNDTIYEDLKLPVFIMDSTLFIRNSEGQVLTFPSRNVDYISKRCFYKRITKSKIKYLAKSGNTLGYFAVVNFSIGTGVVGYEVIEMLTDPAYVGSSALFSGLTFCIVPSAIIIHKLMLRKKMNRMIIESKGLKFF